MEPPYHPDRQYHPRPYLTALVEHSLTTLLNLNPNPTSNQIWAKEYIALSKNPGGYAKMHDGSWDFDTGVDMLFSFWTVSPLSVDHTKVSAC